MEMKTKYDVLKSLQAKPGREDARRTARDRARVELYNMTEDFGDFLRRNAEALEELGHPSRNLRHDGMTLRSYLLWVETKLRVAAGVV